MILLKKRVLMFRVSENKIKEMCDQFGFFVHQMNSSDLTYWRIMCTSPVFAPDTWPGLKNGAHTNSFCDLTYHKDTKEFSFDPEYNLRFASCIYPDSIKNGKLYFKFDRRERTIYTDDEEIRANRKYYDKFIINIKQDIPKNTLELYKYLKECRNVVDKTMMNQKQYLVDIRKNSFAGDFE